MMKSISVSDIWRTGWQRFEKHWLTGVLLMLILVAASFIPILGNLIDFVIQVAFVAYGLQAWDRPEGAVDFGSAFPKRLSVYLKVLAVAIILAVIVFLVAVLLSGALFASALKGGDWLLSVKLLAGAGAAALVLIALQLFIFSYPFFIVERDAGIIESLQQAVSLSRDNLGTVLVFFLYALGINLLGVLTCGIGLFVTVPLTAIALAGLYRTLQAGASPSLSM